MTFIDRLAFIEDHLREDHFRSEADRCAAVILAHDMAAYKADNQYCQKHWAYYKAGFPELLAQARTKLAALAASLPIASYSSSSLEDQIEMALQDGSGLAFFPPAKKSEYETQFQFLHSMTDWTRPPFQAYDPKSLGALLTRLEAGGVPYCVLTDQVFEDRHPEVEYITGRKSPLYAYVSRGRSSADPLSSFVHLSGHNHPAPFHYVPVDVDALTEETQVVIVKAEAKHLNFLKDVYLAKGIVHSVGQLNYLVFLQNAPQPPMLAGGIIYTEAKFAALKESLYLLSDVTITPDVNPRGMKLSKLVSLLATSRRLVSAMEHKKMQWIRHVITAAFSRNPTSMKYRDIFTLHSRNQHPGENAGYTLTYVSDIREQSPQEIYSDWYQKQTQPKKEKVKRRAGRQSSNSRNPETDARNPETDARNPGIRNSQTETDHEGL